MNKKCTTNETFARMKNRNEQKSLSKKLQQLQKEKISALDDIFRQKICLKRLRTVYESSTGSSLSDETTHDTWQVKDNGRQMNYFSRWILFVKYSSQSRPQQEQLNFHQIRQNRLWLMWESRRCTSAPALMNGTRTSPRGASISNVGHLPDGSLRTVSGKYRRWVDQNKISSKDKKHKECSNNSSVSCFQQSNKLKTSKTAKEIQELVPGKEVDRGGEKSITSAGAKTPVEKGTDDKTETKEELHLTECKSSSQTPLNNDVRDSISKISERETKKNHHQEDDWSDNGLKHLFHEPPENSLNSQARDRQIKLSTTGNTWIRLKQKDVRPKSAMRVSMDRTPSPLCMSEQALGVENKVQSAQAKVFGDKLSPSDKLKSDFVCHRGCKIYGYIKPQERHRVDPLRVEWSGQLLTNVRHHSNYVQHESALPHMVFAKPARVKALQRMVRENQITGRRRVANDIQQTILDSKVKSFVQKVEIFNRSSTETSSLTE